MYFKKKLSTLFLGNLKSDSLKRAPNTDDLHASKRFACTHPCKMHTRVSIFKKNAAFMQYNTLNLYVFKLWKYSVFCRNLCSSCYFLYFL